MKQLKVAAVLAGSFVVAGAASPAFAAQPADVALPLNGLSNTAARAQQGTGALFSPCGPRGVTTGPTRVQGDRRMTVHPAVSPLLRLQPTVIGSGFRSAIRFSWATETMMSRSRSVYRRMLWYAMSVSG